MAADGMEEAMAKLLPTKWLVVFSGTGYTKRPLDTVTHDFSMPVTIAILLVSSTPTKRKSMHHILGSKNNRGWSPKEKEFETMEQRNQFCFHFAAETSVAEAKVRLRGIRNVLLRHAATLEELHVSLRMMSPCSFMLFEALLGGNDDFVPAFNSIGRRRLSLRYHFGQELFQPNVNRRVLHFFQILQVSIELERSHDHLLLLSGNFKVDWPVTMVRHLQQLIGDGNFLRLTLPFLDVDECSEYQQLLRLVVSRVPALKLVSTMRSKVHGWAAFVALARLFPTDEVPNGQLQEVELRGHSYDNRPGWKSTVVDALATVINCSPKLETLRLSGWRPQVLGDLSKLRRLEVSVSIDGSEEGVESFLGRLMESPKLRELDIETTLPFRGSQEIACIQRLLFSATCALRTTNLRSFCWTISTEGGVWDGQSPFTLPVYSFLEGLEENQSLFVTELCGNFWSSSTQTEAKNLSVRNACKARVLVPCSNNEFPDGLWPRLLELASTDPSIAYLLLVSNASVLQRGARGMHKT